MMVATLLVVSICVFLAFNIIPGDPALKMLGTEASPELVEQVRAEMGLNDPVLLRYARWFFNFISFAKYYFIAFFSAHSKRTYRYIII